MKRGGATKNRINYDKLDDDKIIISSEYFANYRPPSVTEPYRDFQMQVETTLPISVRIVLYPMTLKMKTLEGNPSYQYPIGMLSQQ